MILATILLFLGLAFIVLELMFPSLGLLSIAAACALIASVAVAWTESTRLGVQFFVATCLLVPGAIMLGMKLLPHGPTGRLLVNKGYTFQDGAAVDVRDRALLGKEGVADSLLRPAGTISIEGRRVDVVTRGEPIEGGTRVRVLEVEGNRVVVAAIEAARAPERESHGT